MVSVRAKTPMRRRLASIRPPRWICATVIFVTSASIFSFAAAGDAQLKPDGSHQHPKPVVLAPGYSRLEFIPPVVGSYLLPPIGVAADGQVIDSQGRARRLHDFVGDKVTVLSFIYTSCNDINGCPLATFVLKGVQQSVLADKKLAGRVRLLSLSFDPDHDTPEVVKAYGKHFKTPGFDWQFLTTASTDELNPILEAYDQAVIRDYDAAGNYLGTLSHILRVVLVDPKRRIRNIYSTSFLHADTVANDIRTLLIQDPRNT